MAHDTVGTIAIIMVVTIVTVMTDSSRHVHAVVMYCFHLHSMGVRAMSLMSRARTQATRSCQSNRQPQQ